MKGLVGWALTGVLVTVLGTGSVLGYQVLVKGWLLVNVGPSGLIFCLIFGAVGGVFIGLIQRWTFGDRRYIEPAVTSDRGRRCRYQDQAPCAKYVLAITWTHANAIGRS